MKKIILSITLLFLCGSIVFSSGIESVVIKDVACENCEKGKKCNKKCDEKNEKKCEKKCCSSKEKKSCEKKSEDKSSSENSHKGCCKTKKNCSHSHADSTSISPAK